MKLGGKAKVFQNGRSQAVRLPQEFRFRGDEVRVRRVQDGVLLEQILEPTDWFDELDRYADDPFMPDGRQQPPTPPGSSL